MTVHHSVQAEDQLCNPAQPRHMSAVEKARQIETTLCMYALLSAGDRENNERDDTAAAVERRFRSA